MKFNIPKKISFPFTVFLLLSACKSNEQIHYLDKNFPGLTPKIYAPEIFSSNNSYDHGITMREFGKEHYSIISGKSWIYEGIIRYTKDEIGKLKIDTITFPKTIHSKSSGIITGEATFSQDEKTMYFVSNYPTDIWKSTIDKNRNWTAPQKLHSSIVDGGSEWYPFIGTDNCLYYSKEVDGESTIFKSKKVNGEYKDGKRFEAAFNYNCGESYFSKKMDFIIFASSRKNGFGNQDLYVSFKNKDNTWSKGYNLGDKINTPSYELAPYISPDEKHLFFTRRDKFDDANSSDIYWVSLDIIKSIKKAKHNNL